MTNTEILLAAIHANPEDDAPRLAYADALDERGEYGDAERAEFIRLQIGLERGQFHHLQQVGCKTGALLSKHGHIWFGDLWSVGLVTDELPLGTSDRPLLLVRRGFVDHVFLRLSHYCRYSRIIAASQPVSKWVLLGKGPTCIGQRDGTNRYQWHASGIVTQYMVAGTVCSLPKRWRQTRLAKKHRLFEAYSSDVGARKALADFLFDHARMKSRKKASV